MIKGRAGDPYCWGVDLAKHTDWSVAIGLDENGRVAACERWQSDWKSTKERLTGLIGSSPALIDMTGVGDPIVEDLQRSCMGIEGYVFTGPSKQRLMEGLASAIHQQLIRIDPQYQVLISELESFEYIVKTTADGRIQGVQYSAPPGMYDDCVCALALAAEMMRTRPIAPVCSVGAITAMVDEEDDDLWQEW